MFQVESEILSQHAVLGLLATTVNGHGRLMEPPGRGSMWRFVDTNELLTPHKDKIQIAYTDNGLNCGGLDYQVSQGGKCGVCGDGFGEAQPRPHEDGGKYGLGIVSKRYAPGEIMHTRSQITAHHKGWIEWKLCPHTDGMSADDLQTCLDSNLLEISGSGTRYYLGKKSILKRLCVILNFSRHR